MRGLYAHVNVELSLEAAADGDASTIINWKRQAFVHDASRLSPTGVPLRLDTLYVGSGSYYIDAEFG